MVPQSCSLVTQNQAQHSLLIHHLATHLLKPFSVGRGTGRELQPDVFFSMQESVNQTESWIPAPLVPDVARTTPQLQPHFTGDIPLQPAWSRLHKPRWSLLKAWNVYNSPGKPALKGRDWEVDGGRERILPAAPLGLEAASDKLLDPPHTNCDASWSD